MYLKYAIWQAVASRPLIEYNRVIFLTPRNLWQAKRMWSVHHTNFRDWGNEQLRRVAKSILVGVSIV